MPVMRRFSFHVFFYNVSLVFIPFLLTIYARTPTTVHFSGTSFTTTAFAPTLELLLINTFPITFAPAFIVTLSPIIGQSAAFEYPIVTC
jgi:hypothetical protein